MRPGALAARLLRLQTSWYSGALGAERGLLGDDEIAALLRRPGASGLTPYAREQAQLDADAVLDGLTPGQHVEDESAA